MTKRRSQIITGIAILAIMFGAWQYFRGSHYHQQASNWHDKANQQAEAADKFRQESEGRQLDLIDAYKHLTAINPSYADRLADLTTPAGNDYHMAKLASQINDVLDDQNWRITWEQRQQKLRPLRIKYAQAIHKHGDFTYIVVPLEALGPVTIGDRSYTLEFDSIDGFPGVALNS